MVDMRTMITTCMDFMISIGNALWGLPLIIMLFAISIIYTAGTKGFQFRYFGHIIKNTFGKNVFGTKNSERGISSFKAFCTALCNTLGTGNIAGVGVAISLGGPWAIFWIWVACLLAMIIKYGEIALGVKYRETDPETGMYCGGYMWYVEKGLGRNWKWIGVVYALFYAVTTAVNGPAVQTNSITATAVQYLPIPSIFIGIFVAILLALILIGGLVRISNFAGRVVPAMALVYFVGTLYVLVMNIGNIPGTFGMIIYSAVHDTQAIAGGFGGAGVAMAVRYGFARGFFSNGAGCGDAPFIHSSADVKHPVEQAMWGVSEVFVDGITCTCTALVILSTGAWETGKRGIALTLEAFSRAFQSQVAGGIFISIILAAFAVTTAVAGAYIGETCLRYIFRDQKKHKWVFILYRISICFSAIMGSSEMFVKNLERVWLLSDFYIAICTILSIIVLFLMRKEVYTLTDEYKESVSQKQ